MKKIFSVCVFGMFLFLLIGCGDNQGEYPDIDEKEEIFMTSEEVVSLLTTLDDQTQFNEAMLLSMNLDISIKQELMDIWTFTKIAENSTDINIQSKTHFLLSENIKEVQMSSENLIDTLIKTTYFEDASLNKEETVTGTFDGYFSNQYLYYNADLKGGSKYIDNGQYQMNVAVTQAMWDDIYVNTDDVLDHYTDIDFDDFSNMDNKKIINALFAAEMIKIYQSGNKTTIVLDVKKRDILDHAYQLLNGIYDTSNWTNTDFNNYKINVFEIPLDMFTFFETQIAYVIEDNQIKKIGCQLYMYIMENSLKIEVSGTFVLDMFVGMPKMPNDLDDYELTEFPLYLS